MDLEEEAALCMRMSSLWYLCRTLLPSMLMLLHASWIHLEKAVSVLLHDMQGVSKAPCWQTQSPLPVFFCFVQAQAC